MMKRTLQYLVSLLRRASNGTIPVSGETPPKPRTIYWPDEDLPGDSGSNRPAPLRRGRK